MDNQLPFYLFHEGTNYEAYKILGSHLLELNGKAGAYFCVWAPNARSVSVVGDFNNWKENIDVMQKNNDSGIYELFIPGIKEYDTYKYAILSTDNRTLLKADPYAYHQETPPRTASKVYDIEGFKWRDEKYIKNLANRDIYKSPINIYELNCGSWKKREDGSYLSYTEIAKELVPYVKEMGYNYIEFMPLAEHPFDGSWGYQVTGYFAITSRYGTPKDFMYLVDECHKNNIGVIMDWVPAHFPKDAHGLYEFDGRPLYENQGWDRIEHATWGTRRFDYGRQEVQSFLISNAIFLMDKYHIDGLRVDAVSSMIYLDFDKKPGEWIPNIYGDNKNLEAIAFIKKLNTEVFARFPNSLMVAEESTAYPLVTRPVSIGGLGFNFKWNMGWMNDILDYFKTDPYFRKSKHGKLMFSLVYAFSENFILPISHDEVVHGKYSLLNKMPGDYNMKFSGMRAFLGYMMSHPGKKLLFMGCEFGQFKEWDFKNGLDFLLLEYDKHKKLNEYVKDLNKLYLKTNELYEEDYSWAGYEWLVYDDADRNVIAYKRRNDQHREIIIICNFSGQNYENYMIGLDEKASYEILLNSDAEKYGGYGLYGYDNLETENFSTNYKPFTLKINLPALSVIYLKKKEVK